MTKNAGSEANPFRTIQAAANVAYPEDVNIAHEGKYRGSPLGETDLI